MFGHMKRYEEERRLREQKKNRDSFVTGAALGFIAGYCARKFIAPKLMTIDISDVVDKEKGFIKSKCDDLKETVTSLKDRFVPEICCCGCDGEDCDCEDECTCEDDCECHCGDDEAKSEDAETSETEMNETANASEATDPTDDKIE
ncbi:hypothetical protein KHM83_08555 [Fusibacter paucivorans]|uniref:YtxH-like protein n=1 Tax=Fusibacter paucivorans TaxID=76009 RepID=A0ABS5PQ62_9FIRM|nr:hypothetical protein [Fusibacter paucivorans]MBS7526726.1 hypothetical protein [Fusibacter paucivorans]